MARHKGVVLVDTNVLIETHRTELWNALSGAYNIETTEACVMETQTGFQNRSTTNQISEKALRARLSFVQSTDMSQQTELLAKLDELVLDLGELSLWAHALTQSDNWILCGPNWASIRSGIRLGHRERIVSLEKLLIDAGLKGRLSLRNAYTTKRLSQTISELTLEEKY